ncbi:hypothetical protein RJ640_011107 [Escallonia rubra]|uniref:Reverse transcriptase zinc-binding domain-containing protein n=1 Tax=Escallonia rubra TaxID=112253 RepID=A0AA88R3P0_9ASTE|nr:hypothetical protein RJ640_011107 [Escallonia rubra]
MVGNGNSILLRIDNWHPFGPLIMRNGSRICYDATRPVNALPNTIVEGDPWIWPPLIPQAMPIAMPSNLVPLPLTEDSYSWTANPCGTNYRLANRIKGWGVISDDKCILCGIDSETAGHLFFACPYS